ncbi:TPA: hypothetical protein ACIBSF_004163 [Salmonella enterica subsp. enterica serovar Chailey]
MNISDVGQPSGTALQCTHECASCPGWPAPEIAIIYGVWRSGERKLMSGEKGRLKNRLMDSNVR